ncbi:MAG: Peptidoglycan hydrolase FlgJ [Pseudomonadota bacterium]|jgi:Rod binding domain-containing protein
MDALNFAKLGQMRADAAKASPEQRGQGMRKAAEQFEAMFIQTMMKTMREATASNEDGDLMGSSSVKTYEALFDQEISQQMAKRGGLGLADMMVKSWERNNPSVSSGVTSTVHTLEQRALSKGLRFVPGLPVQRVDPAMPHALPKGPNIQDLNRDRLTVQTRGGTE